MGLFGGECRKCGQRTFQKDDDGYIHYQCKLALEIEEEHKKPKILCPVCGTEMAKRLLEEHGVIIDRCPKCQGVFLDDGELEKLIKTKRSGNTEADKTAAVLAAGIATGQVFKS